MRFITLMLFVMTFFSSAAIAKMNADANLCEPGRSERSVAGANIDDRIRDLSEWMKEAKGQALANALLMRASLYREKHDWRLAIGDLDRAEVEFGRIGYPEARFSAPELPSAHASLITARGVAYREAGEYQKALRDFDTALQDSPGFSHGYIERGVTNLRADRGDRAIEDFNHVIVNDSNMTGRDRARAYGLRASAWLDKERESYRAEQDTNAASALSYKLCDEVADNFCWLYALWGRWRNDANDGEALVRYWRGNLLSDCSPEVTDRPNLLDSRALVYLQLGQLSDARTSAEAAIRGGPRDGEKYYMLAMIKEAAADRAGAEVDFAKARRLAKPGDWDRWERQQGKFRKLPLPEDLGQQAAKIVDESFEALEKAYSYFSINRPIPDSSDVKIFKGIPNSPAIKAFKEEYSRAARGVVRPNPSNPPLRVAVLAFEDNSEGRPPRCRMEVAASVSDNVARFNRAVGRTVFSMGTLENHDVLFVIGGPLSVPDSKIDQATQRILDAEIRQTSEPNDELFVSFDIPDNVPREGANLHYRESNGELLYANIARSWRSVSKKCSVDLVGDLALAMTRGNSLRLNWATLSSSDNFNLPEKSAPVRREIEACFLLEDPKAAMDQRAECVRLLAARDKDN